MDIKLIASKINNSGGRLYYVGGYVRDKLLGRSSKDIDFCVTGLTKDDFSSLFPNAFLKGNFFPVFQLYNNEFALARKEIKNNPGHSGFLVDTSHISIEEDLFRRDITINSIAIDVLSEEIIDPFNGINDLKNNLLKATSVHFSEDPLRVYRVAQFASRFNFKIEKNTRNMMSLMKSELLSLSPERVFEEMKKALKSDNPQTFFNILKELNLLDVHFKEINDLIGVTQPKEYHPEGDVYNHSTMVLENLSKATTDEKIRFAGLLHDLGKGLTPKEILPHHYNHEKNGIRPARDICNRLKVPNSWKNLALVSVSEHMRASMFYKMSIPKKVSFLEKNYKYLEELELISQADSKNPNLKFAYIGKQMQKEVNGSTIILPNNKNAKLILHEKRIEWLKNYEARIENT